jgi:hypothetical protein
MNQSNQQSCQCEKASCPCEGAKIEHCPCGDTCGCGECNCAGGCGCGCADAK